MTARVCRVAGCPMPVAGEVTVWRYGGRSPLYVTLCSVHLDRVHIVLAEVLEGAREVAR